ncbi:serine/threonine-protein kinase [Arenimonas daejeonensis]|uniref:serine/threonine-protein kinase n=1 Tax=Arenimonas daejeonensis TaxID=370777 RepID=UPI0013155693|nr:serine/threonine-protein kinase [Arenimonas daejeonensis]
MTTQGQDDLSPTEALPTRSGGPGPAPEGALPAGTRLGRYRIEALLGRGGMGEVYRAEQLEPVHRTVALKLLNARRLDARHLAYFEVERQLLAQMKHPAIAQVFDAGATPEGHPFFAMEFIEGSALTGFCEQRRLPLRERLELFIRVCEGVQHAHQKGVIHRDLKPGNLLVAEVDGRPLPKIIDFGIATAASRSLAVGERVGELERAGTPDYMSPEQAGLEPGAEVDTRSDVYSLGVILWELLAGHRPGAGTETGAAPHTASTTVPPPSEQIATLAPGLAAARATQLGISPTQLRRLLRTELDWVVLKAMRRDRAQRYSSAAELADELRRFLEGRPLVAVPHSRRYVLGKYIARNRLAVAASAAVAAALIAGLGLSLYGLQQAREQRAIAEQRSAELERVVAFQQSMLEGVDIEAMGVGLASGLREQLGKVDPERVPALEALLARTSPADLARSLVDRNILASAETAIERDFADQPALAADLRESVAEVHEALGLAAAAEAGYTRVGDYREQALGPGHPDTLRVRTQQAGVMLSSAKAKEANALMEQVMSQSVALPPDGDQRLAIELRMSETIAALGDRVAARELQQALYTRAATARGGSDPKVLVILNNLAITQARTGELPTARAAMERLYPLRREVIGPEHEDTLASMSNLAVMRAMMGDLEQALELQQQLVEIQSRRLGAEHPITLNQRNNLGNMLLDLGRLDEAEATMREVLEARERVLGPDSTDSLRSRLNLSSLLVRRERIDEGLAMEAQVIAARTRILGPDHPDTLFVRINHAGTLRRAGQPEQALAEVRAVLPAAREVLGPKNPQLHAALAVQGDALARPATGRVPWPLSASSSSCAGKRWARNIRTPCSRPGRCRMPWPKRASRPRPRSCVRVMCSRCWRRRRNR